MCSHTQKLKKNYVQQTVNIQEYFKPAWTYSIQFEGGGSETSINIMKILGNIILKIYLPAPKCLNQARTARN